MMNTKKRFNEAAEAKRMAGEDGNDQGEAEDDSMLIKIKRVATRTAISWKRSTSTSTDPTQGRSSCLAVERPTYLSRLIACNRCGTPKKRSGYSYAPKPDTELPTAGTADCKRYAHEVGANASSSGINVASIVLTRESTHPGKA